MSADRHAAVVTIGTELTEGLRYDTNSRDVARVLIEAGYAVRELVSLPDDEAAVSDALHRLLAAYSFVVVTGGLGPTHDDITRQAASRAVGRPLVRDERIADSLAAIVARHAEPLAAARVLAQADVIEGARSLPPSVGTAPGMLIEANGATLILLPGPPREMRPMLEALIGEARRGIPPVILGCFGITESDAQARIEPVLASYPDIMLTLLAGLQDLEVVLLPRGANASRLTEAAESVREVLGRDCFSADGASLATTVLRMARERALRVACAESCTGGLVSAALTDVPGASDVFAGGIVSYSNDLKTDALKVPPGLIETHGAVSSEVALAMAEGALTLTGVDIAISVTGIAGPEGGSAGKPVGLVWFGIACADGHRGTVRRTFSGDRTAVRTRASATALDLVRRLIEERFSCGRSSL